jgi:4-amino-4-deoxy-L-arabinose transferase-like glycosyltransferase
VTWLAGILVLAVILRLGVALYLGDVVTAPPLLTDQRAYHTLGIELLAGHGFSFPTPWYPFTPPNTPTAHWSFLQSLYVAGVYTVFGVHPLAARLVTAVLGGILLPWMVYRLARRVFSGGEINNYELTIVTLYSLELHSEMLNLLVSSGHGH